MDFLKFLGKATAFILYLIMSFFIVIIGLGSQGDALQDYRYSNVYVWQSADLSPDEKRVLVVDYGDLISFNKHLNVDLYKENNIEAILTSKNPIFPVLSQDVPLETTNIPYSQSESRHFILQNIKLLSAKDVEDKTIHYFLQGKVFNTDFDFGQNNKVITTGISPTDTKQADKIYFFILIFISILLAIVAGLFGLKAIKNRKMWGYLIVSCAIMVTISFLIVGFGAIKTLIEIFQ